MAEIDLMAQRRAAIGRKGPGQVGAEGLPGPCRDDDEDPTEHAEKQVKR